MVPESVTVHSTPTPHNSINDAGERFYFKARNQLWLLRAGRSFRGVERTSYGVRYVRSIYRYIRQSPDSPRGDGHGRPRHARRPAPRAAMTAVTRIVIGQSTSPTARRSAKR